MDDGAAVTDVRTQGTAQVRTGALSRPLGAPRLARRRADDESRHQPADGCELVGIAFGEVLGTQQLGLGGGLPDVFRTRPALTAGDGGGRVERARVARVDSRRAATLRDEARGAASPRK